MAHGSIATGFPLTCRLCPNNLLPDDGHDICPSCLGIQHLREALTDPCVHCSLLPMSERRLRLAELDPNSTVKLGQLDVASTCTRKRRASPAAGAPLPAKKKAKSRSDEHAEKGSLSVTVSMLSSEMAELKRLLHSLQPATSTTPVSMTQEDENVQNLGAGGESLDSPCFLTVQSLMCFLRVLQIPFFMIMGILWMLLRNHHLRLFSLVTQLRRVLVGDQFNRLEKPSPPLMILWLCFEWQLLV